MSLNTRGYLCKLCCYLSVVVLIILAPNQGAAQQQSDRIVFMSDRDGSRDIYTMRSDGDQVERLTNDSAQDLQPAWSPDKNSIAFVSNRDGDFGIYIMNADGRGTRMIVGGNSAYYEYPVWSPDGRQIVYSSDVGGSFDLYAVSANGGESTRLTSNEGDETDPSWSPDATQLVYLQTVQGAYEVFVISASGGQGQRVVESIGGDYFSPRWSPDGHSIAYATTVSDAVGSVSDIYVLDLEQQTERLLVSEENSFITGISWSTDGSQLTYAVRGIRGNWTINRIDIDGFSTTVLTQPDSNSETPSWSTPGYNASAVQLIPTGGSTSVGSSVDCPGAPPPRLIIGDSARVTPGLPNRLRAAPGVGGRQIDTIPPGGRMRVVGGPQCINGYMWWEVEYGTNVGWTAEGEVGDYWLEPLDLSSGGSTAGTNANVNYPTRCAQSLPTRIGINVRIMAMTQVRLRESPTSVLGTSLADGTDMETTGAPICEHIEGDPGKAELLWWPVRVLEGSLTGAEGWIAESGSNRYNVAIDPTP